MDPLYWIRYPHKTSISLGRALASGLDLRAESDGALKTLTSDATDPYATIRSAYLQNLQSQVNGDSAPVQALPDFDDTTSPPPATPKAQAPGDQPPSDTTPPPAPPADAPASPPAPSPAAPPNSPVPGADDGE